MTIISVDLASVGLGEVYVNVYMMVKVISGNWVISIVVWKVTQHISRCKARTSLRSY